MRFPKPRPSQKGNPFVRMVAPPFLAPFKLYHRYSAVGVHNIPREGPAILALSHSFATYDGFLFGMAVHEQLGRLIAGLGDNLIFRIPGLSCLAGISNIVPANPRNAQRLLEDGFLLGVAPGGMREALRPTTERYQVRWQSRKGFVKMSILTGAPIILAACPAADDLYSVYESPLTKIGYKSFKLPVPIIRGLGPTLIPRPVRLTHYVSSPLHPPKLDLRCLKAQVDEFHEEVVETMQALMLTEETAKASF